VPLGRQAVPAEEVDGHEDGFEEEKKIPSMLKGMPIAPPNFLISPGHSNPISKESRVPETAPTATRTA
jgi:hypothetical protein